MQPSTNPNQEALRNQLAAMTAEFERQRGPVQTLPIRIPDAPKWTDFSINLASTLAHKANRKKA